MAEELLGPVFEIHGGGLDLVFPASRERARAVECARTRLRSHLDAQRLLRFTGSKMSKSEGNIVTIREPVERWGREAILVYFMTGHWSKPIDFSEETMAAAQARVDGFREVLRAQSQPIGDWDEFAAALEDDFNTPDALACCTAGATTTCCAVRSTSSASRRSRDADAPPGDRRARRAAP
jgi:cysteinyl-tRNA synthetase